MEKDIRRAVMKLERRDAAWPMMGAFWLFFGCGLSFLVFPLGVASAACAMVAVGDGLSTLVGKRWGRSKVVGSKSWEGTITMFVACIFTGMYFVGPVIAVFGAVAAAFFELLPELGCFRRHREMGIIDDNLLVPLAAGAVMLAAYVF
jgi:dolichol kinase